MNNAEISELYSDVCDSLEIYEQIIGGRATNTRNMIERHGLVNALSKIVVSGEIQKGFRKLRDSNKLDITFEEIVVRHHNLFDVSFVKAAKFRLENAHLL